MLAVRRPVPCRDLTPVPAEDAEACPECRDRGAVCCTPIAAGCIVDGLLFGLRLQSGDDGAVAMVDRLKLIARAVSLGDVESLIRSPGDLIHPRRETDPNNALGTGIAWT